MTLRQCIQTPTQGNAMSSEKLNSDTGRADLKPPSQPYYNWKLVVLPSVLLTAMISLEIVIICLLVNQAQNLNSQNSICLPRMNLKAGEKTNDLIVRGRILELTNLMSWEGRCNSILHDLVFNCYGPPDFVTPPNEGEKTMPLIVHNIIPRKFRPKPSEDK